MAKLDEQSSEVKTKKAKTIDGIIFLLLLIGAVAMVFPLLYMVLSYDSTGRGCRFVLYGG